MNIRLPIVVLGGLALAGGIAAWKMGTGQPAARLAQPVSAPAPFAPASGEPAPALGSPVAGSDEHVKLEQDKAVVFQRAFWRRPGARDRILHGERRDWIDATAAVKKWQWFVAVAPSPEFRRWLLEDNPFELTLVAAPGEGVALESPPAWFSPAESLGGFAQYRMRGGRLVVFHDPKSNRIFAADAGAGFAAAVR